MRRASLLAFILGVAGCGAQAGAPGNLTRPTVLGLTVSDVTVGQSVGVIGGGFMNNQMAKTELEFVGTYTAEDGSTNNVDYRVSPIWKDAGNLTWGYFGPFKIPFSTTGDQLGTF